MYRVRSGLIAGREHILSHNNCQDALQVQVITINGGNYIIGVIADGCSEGAHSEVGAQLSVRFIIGRIQQYLQLEIPLQKIGNLLFQDLIYFLKSIVTANQFGTPEELVSFIKDYLLFTTLGCIVSDKETVIFTAGDGIIVLNDQITIIDQQNAPLYLGYQLIDRTYLEKTAAALPNNFDMYFISNDQLQRLAFGSDAWIDEQELLSQIWDTRGRGELQMRMNNWSKAKRLKDDASLIVIEVEPSL